MIYRQGRWYQQGKRLIWFVGFKKKNHVLSESILNQLIQIIVSEYKNKSRQQQSCKKVENLDLSMAFTKRIIYKI